MGVKKEYDTLGSLRVQFGIPGISITFLILPNSIMTMGC